MNKTLRGVALVAVVLLVGAGCTTGGAPINTNSVGDANTSPLPVANQPAVVAPVVNSTAGGLKVNAVTKPVPKTGTAGATGQLPTTTGSDVTGKVGPGPGGY